MDIMEKKVVKEIKEKKVIVVTEDTKEFKVHLE